MMTTIIEEFRQKGLSKDDAKIILAEVGDDTSKFARFAQRRLYKEPFAYIFKKADFMGNSFYVDRRVYVPNPETAGLVDVLTSIAPDDSTILEVGCGSGAVAISVKLRMPKARVYGVDIDPAALEVAEKNAKEYGVNIYLAESLYADDVEIVPDFIVADLPYGNASYTLPSIDIAEFAHMSPVALFHPKGVLTGYQEFINSILKKGWGTTLLIETGRVEKEKVEEIIPAGLPWRYQVENGYSVTTIYF